MWTRPKTPIPRTAVEAALALLLALCAVAANAGEKPEPGVRVLRVELGRDGGGDSVCSYELYSNGAAFQRYGSRERYAKLPPEVIGEIEKIIASGAPVPEWREIRGILRDRAALKAPASLVVTCKDEYFFLEPAAVPAPCLRLLRPLDRAMGEAFGKFYRDYRILPSEGPRGPTVPEPGQAGERGKVCPLPRALMAALAKEFPSSRRVTAYDLSEEDFSEFYESKPPECWGMLRADFDGDGAGDFALQLYEDKARVERVVVAFSRRGGWHLEELGAAGPSGRPGEDFIQLVPPGRQESLVEEEALTPEDRKEGWVATWTSATPGIYWSGLESCGTYYYWSAQGWKKL